MIRIESADLDRMARDLHRLADPAAVRKLLAQELAREVRPAGDAARAAYRSAPSHNPNPHLRAHLARGVRVDVRTSGANAGVRVETRAALAAVWEGVHPWRHPVYGTHRVVTQRSPGTFHRAVAPYIDRAQIAADRAAQHLQRAISGRGSL